MIVDLMGRDVWSESDITHRTESMVRQYFSLEAEQILNRKVTGTAMGLYQMTADEQAELAYYAAVCEVARLEGVQARIDMPLLAEAMSVEAAERRLAQPVEDTEDDEAQRAAAQAVIDVASPEALALVELRRPPATIEERDE